MLSNAINTGAKLIRHTASSTKIAWPAVLLALLLTGCGNVPEINKISPSMVGEPTFATTVAGQLDAPIVSGNSVRMLYNGEQIFPAMLQAIRSAQKSITFSQYLYDGDNIGHEFARAFAERCRAGVKVKLLIDSQGSASMPADIPALWVQSGCDLRWFHRIKLFQFVTPWELLKYNYRNHRRVLVVDGKIGFTGGVGVSDAWGGDGRSKGHWLDTDVRLEGPIVRQLQSAFAESWRHVTGEILGGEAYFPVLQPVGNIHAQVVKSSPLSGSYDTYLLLLMSITAAKKSIYITNPYCLPDDRLTEALLAAVSRGVRVVFLAPGVLDSQFMHEANRRGFGPLLRGGVKIYEYQPALLHAKTIVIDGKLAIVGSTNIDNRSFALNEEIDVAIHDRGIAGELEKTFERDLELSKEITYESWESRPLSEKFLELFTLPFDQEL